MIVNFIGIGGQRCGKTTIYNWMEEHPQVITSSEMELHFFNHRYDYGYNWYERNFLWKKRTLISGEMSSSYIYDLSVPKRVFKYSPDMKIVLSVRNPIDRLISAYRHDIQIGNVISDGEYSISKGIENNPTYLEYGLYAKYFNEWLNIFPKENILVVIFEEMIKTPHQSYLQLCEFLNIDNSFTPRSINKKLNHSWLPKSRRLMILQKNIAKIFRSVGLGLLVDGLKTFGLKKMIDSINTDKKSTIVDMDNDYKNYLIEYFKEDVQKLSKLLNIDLKKLWLE
jgi:hypothetical protein